MFAVNDINDFELPNRTLCLTYDDGPGEHSVAIAEYLHSKGIRATFFVVGKFAATRTAELKRMSELGHIIANHTFEHPDLPYYVSLNGDICDQVIRTNAIIAPYVNSEKTYFRAPYGKWSPEVTADLNTNLKSSHHTIGPVHWDIPGIDCYYWKLGKTVEETVGKYLEEIEAKGKGVIVMHDEIADMDVVKPLNKTHLLTRALVDELLKRGYQFIGLDQVKSFSMKESGEDGFVIFNQSKSLTLEGDRVLWSSKASEFSMKMLENGKVQFMTQQGHFLRVDPDKDVKVIISQTSDKYSKWDYIPVKNEGFMLRTYNGNYIGQNSQEMQADAPFMRGAAVLRFEYKKQAYRRKKSLSDSLNLMKRRLKFIKSKLLQS